LGVARHDLARGLELDAITIAVVGGCAIRGGKGSIPGTILALLLVMLIRTAMGVANVKAEYQLTAIGLLLVVAVGIGGIRSPQS
jgi:ribose/xylose/arabinose/galactoside ABC-type transport system permease subunit